MTIVSAAGRCEPDSLQAQADAELARRAPAGMLVVGFLAPLLLLSNNYFRAHAVATVTALALTYGSIALRSWLIWWGGNLYCSRRKLWVTLTFLAVLTPPVMWDVFYCLDAIWAGSDSWDALVFLLCMVSTGFGALHTFTPMLSLVCAYEYALLIGAVVVNAYLEGPHHWMIAAGTGMLLTFMTMQARVLYAQYWSGLRDRLSLRKAMEEAESASASKSAFLANMSHEIRTPLNGVLGMIAVILESELSDQQREHLEVARQSGLLLQGILNDVLDLSKIEAGKVTLEMAEFDLEATLSGVTQLIMPKARQKGLDLRLQYAAKAPRWFRGDEGKIRQIALNFVDNAVKFTARGGVTVVVSAERSNERAAKVTIAVRDTGIGIGSQQQSLLFEKFSQADASTTRKYGGTGLGLVISKRLAEAMGGSVGVVSAAEAGSTFWTTLPLATVEAPQEAEAKAALDGAHPEQRHGRVLVVEDNGVNQRIVTRLLERRGLQVDVAANGREAVRMFLANIYSMIFMDCQMPEMDGYQATREIRTQEKHLTRARTPIVAMTANAMFSDREICLQAGMDDYVSKPLAVAELERVLALWGANEAGTRTEASVKTERLSYSNG